MGQTQQVSVTLLCPLLGISRQSFYAFFRQQTQHAFEEEIVLAEVLRIRALLPRLGTRKLLHKMQHFWASTGFVWGGMGYLH